MFSIDTILQVAPNVHNPNEWAAGLTKTFDRYEINTSQRLAAFLAQVIFESQYFVHLEENMNYSEQGLHETFRNYFPPRDAAAYARQPERIANCVYANRMGNGDEASGDGWSFRGHGLLQITGRYMFQQFANSMKMSLADTLRYVATVEGACMSAGWFWSVHKLNALADEDRITEITLRINGGTNGLAERKALWSRLQTWLA